MKLQRDFTGNGISVERRDVTDSARGIGFDRERRDVKTVQGGKMSLGRDVILQTVQGKRDRCVET